MDKLAAALSVHDFACRTLSERLDKLDKEWASCADKLDADAVHDIRVALRRFGETLRLFKKHFSSVERSQVRTELRGIMRLTGNLRNTDITLASFTDTDIPVRDQIKLIMQNARATAEAALAAALAVGHRTDFAGRWRRALRLHESLVQENDAHESIVARAKQNLPELLVEYYDEGRHLLNKKPAPKKLHQLRLSTKHLRYALESYRPLFGPRLDVLIQTLRQTQSLLGDISDATATIVWLDELKIRGTAEGQALADHLQSHAQKKAGEFAGFWQDQWEQPGERERWIRYLSSYAGRVTSNRKPVVQDSSVSPQVLSV
jgi:CHAD domain-containing protein